MRLFLIIPLLFLGCDINSANDEITSAEVVANTVQQLNDTPEKTFFIEVEESDKKVPKWLKIFDTNKVTTFPDDFRNTYHGRVIFVLEKEEEKWIIIDQKS